MNPLPTDTIIKGNNPLLSTTSTDDYPLLSTASTDNNPLLSTTSTDDGASPFTSPSTTSGGVADLKNHKINCAAETAMKFLGCLTLTTVSATTAPISWMFGATFLGGTFSWATNGGDGLFLEKSVHASMNDLYRIAATTAVAILFPQTAPWAALVTAISFGSLVYREVRQL